MNPKEQKNHKTAMNDLENGVVTFTEETVRQLYALRADITRNENRITEEHRARLKLAGEQRHYVDGENREIRQRIDGFTQRGFWSRINWLLTGR